MEDGKTEEKAKSLLYGPVLQEPQAGTPHNIGVANGSGGQRRQLNSGEVPHCEGNTRGCFLATEGGDQSHVPSLFKNMWA